jgi:hypothetical protein
MMNISVEDAIRTIRREFRDLTNDEFNSGIARAINHTLGKAKTNASREIRQVYNLSAKDVGKSLTIKSAYRNKLWGFIVSSSGPIPLSKFKPIATKTGVSVMIRKGSRQQIHGAFMPAMASGHSGVFARGVYGSSEFKFRHRRTRTAGGYKVVNGRYQPVENDLEINELSTLSIPKAFSNAVVLRQIKTKIEDDFPSRMIHELQRLRR